MSRAEYESIQAVNWSTLKHILTSPLHYRLALEHPPEDRPAWVLGRAVHAAILEPARFVGEWAVYPGAVRRGKEWDAFRSEHSEHEIVRADEYETALAMAESVAAHVEASALLTRAGAVAEQPITWTDPATGIACKGIPDMVAPGILLDVKTATTIERRQMAAAVARYAYHAQLAYYSRGLVARGATAPACYIVAVESHPPHDVAVYRLPEAAVRAGDRLVSRALALLAECRELDEWPGQAPDVVDLDLPAWAGGDEGEIEITVEPAEVW